MIWKSIREGVMHESFPTQRMSRTLIQKLKGMSHRGKQHPRQRSSTKRRKPRDKKTKADTAKESLICRQPEQILLIFLDQKKKRVFLQKIRMKLSFPTEKLSTKQATTLLHPHTLSQQQHHCQYTLLWQRKRKQISNRFSKQCLKSFSLPLKQSNSSLVERSTILFPVGWQQHLWALPTGH